MMKIKELISRLESLNPEKEIYFRAYLNGMGESYEDMSVSDLRLDDKKGYLVLSNQAGVE